MTTYHYESAAATPGGPVTRAVLDEMHQSGALSDDSFVLPSGSEKWVSYGALPDVGTTTPMNWQRRFNLRLARATERIDGLLEILLSLPKVSSARRGEAYREHLVFLNNLSHVGIAVLGIVAGVVTILVSLKFDASQGVITGALVVPGAFVLLYLSQLFAEANLRLAFGEPIHLLTPLVPRMFCLAMCVGAIVLLIGGLVTLWETFEHTFTGGVAGLLGLLGVVCFLSHTAWVTGHAAEVMKVSYERRDTQSSADYVCNLVRFAGRLLLLLLPVSSATGVIVLLSGGVLLLLEVGLSSPLGLLSMLDQVSGVALLPLEQALRLMGAGSLALSVPFLLMLGTPVLGQVAGHFIYLLLTLWAEIGHGFFRMAESLQKLSSAAQKPGSTTSTLDTSTMA